MGHPVVGLGTEGRTAGRSAAWKRSHSASARVVFTLSDAESLQERRDVHAETPSESP